MQQPTREKSMHVPCPYCSNRRLFDCKDSSEGVIEIKCQHCKKVVVIDLHKISQRRREMKFKNYNKIVHNMNRNN